MTVTIQTHCVIPNQKWTMRFKQHLKNLSSSTSTNRPIGLDRYVYYYMAYFVLKFRVHFSCSTCYLGRCSFLSVKLKLGLDPQFYTNVRENKNILELSVFFIQSANLSRV